MRKLAKRLVSPESGLVCPDHWSGPDWVYTDGPAVAELNASANFAPDPQQELGLDLIFAVGANGLPASFSFCVICCRQNLKTGLLKQAAIGWLYVTDERLVVWSAHELSTTSEAQRELGEMMQDTPALSKRMPVQKNRGIYEDNNKTRIELVHNGFTQQIRFKARQKTGGRGLSGDKVVLDEAFALEPSHVGSLLPTMAARPHGQVLYASSAGLMNSEVLRDVRDRGRSGASPRMYYLEWGGAWRDCRDPDCLHPKDAETRGIDCALDDRELWRRNNPTISTGRISEQTIADLRQELPPSEFARECMGKWDDAGDMAGPPAINVRTWLSKALNLPDTPAPARAALVIDVAPDRSRSSIGVAGQSGERVLLLSHTKPGFDWVVPQLVKMRDKGELNMLEVALHPTGQAGVLLAPLAEAGFKTTKKDPGEEPGRVRHLTSSDVARGCATLQHAVIEQRIAHLGQDEITDAIAVARTRILPSEAETWDRRDQAFEISPVVSIATALHRWDLLTAVPDTPPPPPRRARKSTGRAIDRVGF